MECLIDLRRYHKTLNTASPISANGKVTKIVGLVTEANGPASRLGSICDIYPQGDIPKVRAEVMGFRDNKILLMPLGEIRGISPGNRVVAKQQNASIRVGKDLLGRVIDGLGNPIDGKGPILFENEYPIYTSPMNPL